MPQSGLLIIFYSTSTNTRKEVVMAQQDAPVILKVGLVIAMIILAIYGLLMFLIPAQYVALIGANPIENVWLRWAGGVLIALAVGAWMMLRSPANQGVLFKTLNLGFLLAGLALAYSWAAGEYSGRTISVAFPAILNLVVAVLLFLGWRSAKDLLR